MGVQLAIAFPIDER